MSHTVQVHHKTELRNGSGLELGSIGLIDIGTTVLVSGQDLTGEWFQLDDGNWIPGKALASKPPVPIILSAPDLSAPVLPVFEEVVKPMASGDFVADVDALAVDSAFANFQDIPNANSAVNESTVPEPVFVVDGKNTEDTVSISDETSVFQLISAHALTGTVTTSKPKISHSELIDAIQTWIAKQDSFWPTNLTTPVLSHNIQCVYAPHWILDGSASGTWSASIGVDRTVKDRCGTCAGTGRRSYQDIYGKQNIGDCYTCGGSGQTSRTVTDWFSQSGVATGVISGSIIENVAANTPIRCGKRDYGAEEHRLKQPFPNNVIVLQPESIGDAAGKAIAEKAVRQSVEYDARQAATSLGRVRDLRTGYIQIDRVAARLWLYPIWVGSYMLDGKTHLIEMDGITGKLYVEVPSSVRNKRIGQWLTYFAGIALVILIIWLVVMFIGNSGIVIPGW